jgi:hypothetical protein
VILYLKYPSYFFAFYYRANPPINVGGADRYGLLPGAGHKNKTQKLMPVALAPNLKRTIQCSTAFISNTLPQDSAAVVLKDYLPLLFFALFLQCSTFTQVDQIGRILDCLAIVFFGQFFGKSQKCP